MEFTPFALDEATEIWDDFEDLNDTEFSYNAKEYFVNEVVICPFSDSERARFITTYESTKDSKQAIEGYSGADYDVVIVATDLADESGYTYISIRSFASEKGISYNFPG